MANTSSFSQIYALYSGSLNSTFMTTSCPSSETDYTMYFKAALILLVLLVGGIISGSATLTRAVRSLEHAVREQHCPSCHSHGQDVEARPSTSLFDEPDVCEKALDVDSTDLARPQAANRMSDHNARGDSNPFASNPEHPSSPPQKKKSRKFWKKVQTAVSNGGWATAMNVAALAVAVGCVLSGPSTIQCDLPAPATESRRSR